jgi:hypothetical protein
MQIQMQRPSLPSTVTPSVLIAPSEPTLPSGGKRRKNASRYGLYEDLEEIMFGFGDSWPPEPDSVELMEKIAVQYIKDLCVRALQVSSITGKLDKECFMYQVTKPRLFYLVRQDRFCLSANINLLIDLLIIY